MAMNASRFLLALSLAAGTTVALAASGDPTPATDPAWMSARSGALRNGVDYVAQNQAEMRRLEAQGFPQYAD
jgi:hypothetical protein